MEGKAVAEENENRSIQKKENENKSLEKSSEKVPINIDLGPAGSIDLSHLPEKERNALMVDHAKNMIDVQKRALEMNVDAGALKKTLDDMTGAAKSANENETSATLSHTQSSQVGRTEVMIGNTEKANKGKFSNSQTGEKDLTPYYIFGGILAVVIIFALMRG